MISDRSRADVLLLAVIALVVLVLLITRLDDRYLWEDEWRRTTSIEAASLGR